MHSAENLAEVDPSFKPIFDNLFESRTKIVLEFTSCQSTAVGLGRCFLFSVEKANSTMNPSPALTSILDGI